MSDHDDNHPTRLDELLALAALGELTEADERELDAALAADVELQEELDADLATAAQIQSTDPAAPPESLKASVLAAIDAVDTGAPDEAPAPVSLDAARDRRRARWVPFAAAAAVALLFVGGVVATRSDDGGDDVYAVVVNADDAEVRPFEGEVGGSLRAVYSPTVGALVVDGVGVDVLEDSETYQLWLVGDDGVRSVGLFRPDGDGRVEIGFDDTDPDGLVLGITIEPAGGSAEPTLPIVATA